MTDYDSIIRIEGLQKAFGGKRVLRGVDLNIVRNEINFIIGRSGGGKSVLLKHIIGLLEPDSGHIYLDGQDLVGLRSGKMNQIRMRFGMLFQEAALFDSMTVGQNVAFPLKAHTRTGPREIKRLVREKLELVGLEGVEDLRPSEISGGMRKRVGLARAIILDPEILLFDEPTTGLDPIMSNQVDELILSAHETTGATAIVISHDIPATLRIANRVAMIYKGRIVIWGRPEDLTGSKNELIKQFLKGEAQGPMRLDEEEVISNEQLPGQEQDLDL